MKRFSYILAVVCAFVLAVTVAAPPAMATGVLASVQDKGALLSPTGLLMQADGTLLVADNGLNSIVSIKDGRLQPLAGHTLPVAADGLPAGGYLDAAASSALFHGPFALAVWNGGVAVSDRSNHTLRWIKDGAVKTLAGDGISGLRDGAAKQARFASPAGLAISPQGVLYIADSENGCIRTLSADGEVSTYLRGLSMPTGLCWDGGALYVAESGAHRILKIVNGVKTVLAGAEITEDGVSVGGFQDGAAGKAAFCAPMGVTVANGVVYVADTGNSAVRKIQNGWVSTLACFAGGSGVLPVGPVGLAAAGNTLYVADGDGGAVFTLDLTCQMFADVKADAAYASAVSYLYTEGVMQGVSATQFRPDAPCTRAQIVTMLYRLADQPAGRGNSFADVKVGAYYERSVKWAVGEKLVLGQANGLFAPNRNANRQQVALILQRYAAWEKGGTADGGTMEQAMEWAVSIGAFSATASPTGAVTRGELAMAFAAMMTA